MPSTKIYRNGRKADAVLGESNESTLLDDPLDLGPLPGSNKKPKKHSNEDTSSVETIDLTEIVEPTDTQEPLTGEQTGSTADTTEVVDQSQAQTDTIIDVELDATPDVLDDPTLPSTELDAQTQPPTILASDETTTSSETDVSTSPTQQSADALAATGNNNPTVSYNLNNVSDWSTQSAFIDISKTMRPWIGHEDGWGGMTYEELQEQGYLDENGWVKEIPDGFDSVGTTWAWGEEDIEYRKGVYVLEYEGEGDIELTNVNILSQEDGRIVFENVDGKAFQLRINETDPNSTGDYIRDISIVHEDHLALHEAGAVFNPDWLEIISDARELRFMDWMETNNSTLSSWDDRPQVDDASWDIVPVEIMVQLANEAGVDPWFNIPHMADDEYIREFAEYVRDNLDPDLTAHVEWSNEVWNAAFDQYHYAAAQGQALWGTENEYKAVLDYQGMRATETALIWEEVFSQSESAPELANVIGSRLGNDGWSNNRVLTAPSWQANDPDGYVAPHSVFDELAVTTYFGNATVSNEELRLELLQAIDDPSVDATQWLAEKLMDPDYPKSIPQVAAELADNKAVADQYGLDLVAYEGGQHVHHSFAVQGLTESETQALTDFMTEFVRSPEMAELYAELWQVWAEVSDGSFMQFGDVGSPSKYGSWSILSHQDDVNPRSEFLFDQQQNATPWWETDPNDAYLQGVNIVGGDGNDTITGTNEEDYLAGGLGDDVFIAGAGSDGINGGEGFDTLHLSGISSDYTIVADGDGYLISGPDGEKFVINVETLHFSNGQDVTLAETQNPVPPSEDSTLSTNFTGTIHDPAPDTEVFVETLGEYPNGITVSAINKYSLLGKELALGSDAHEAGFVVYENGTTATIASPLGQVATYEANYFTLQQNQTGNDGEAITDSATTTALAFGDIFLDPAAIHGTEHADRFFGRATDNKFFGQGGNDYLTSSGGNNILDGGAGRDQIFGGTGDDLIIGGEGNDVLSGKSGSDRFYIKTGDGQDRILDFDAADTLELSDYLADGATLADSASTNGEGTLVISNGTDSITLDGLTLDDLNWITIA